MWVKEEEKATLKRHKIGPGLHWSSLLIFTKTCFCYNCHSALAPLTATQVWQIPTDIVFHVSLLRRFGWRLLRLRRAVHNRVPS